MSTKIRGGYRLAEGTNPFEFIRGLRAVLDPVRDRADGALLARLFATAADTRWLAGEPVPPLLGVKAFTDWEARQSSLAAGSRAKDPHRFQMCLGEDPVTGRLLARAYAEHPELVSAFEAMPAVEPYSYWDDADAPGTVTEEEWDERRAAWERVLPDYGVPAEHMLSFVLRTEANPGTMMLAGMNGGAADPVLSRFPTRAERAITMAETTYRGHLIASGHDQRYASSRAFSSRTDLSLVAGAIEPFLPELTRTLLLEGSGGSKSGAAVRATVAAACAAAATANSADPGQ